MVENIAGGAMNIGADRVARASPDGHTLLVAPPSPLSFNHLLYRDLTYDPRQFVPITMLAKVPNVLVVRKDLPAQSLGRPATRSVPPSTSIPRSPATRDQLRRPSRPAQPTGVRSRHSATAWQRAAVSGHPG